MLDFDSSLTGNFTHPVNNKRKMRKILSYAPSDAPKFEGVPAVTIYSFPVTKLGLNGNRFLSLTSCREREERSCKDFYFDF